MKSILIDTHTWVWSLQGESRLSETAVRALRDSDEVRISPISFYEIAQKVRIGKWNAMAVHTGNLAEIAERQGVLTATLLPAICAAAGLMPWRNRDPFDRIIVATALHYGLPVLSVDTKFDDVVTRIW